MAEYMSQDPLLKEIEFWISLGTGLFSFVSLIKIWLTNREVKKLTNKFQFKGRAPDLLNEINRKNKELSTSFNFTNLKMDRTEIIVDLCVLINNLKSKIKKHDRPYFRKTAKHVFVEIVYLQKVYDQSKKEEDAKNFYYKIVELIKIIELYIVDQQWS